MTSLPCHLPLRRDQNGDLMRDPEVCFEMQIEAGKVKKYHPYDFRNGYAGMKQDVMDVNTGPCGELQPCSNSFLMK